MYSMIERQRLLRNNRFRIAAIFEDIVKYKEVNGDNMCNCGEFSYFDEEYFFGRPLEGKVKLLIHYI